MVPNYDTSDPPGHFRLNSKVIKGDSETQGSKGRDLSTFNIQK